MSVKILQLPCEFPHKLLELTEAFLVLQLSSFVQLTGAGLCLHGAAQITHRAQRIVSIVSQWHAVATCGHYVPPAAYSQPCSPHSFAGSTRFSYARPREDSTLHDIRHLDGWGLKHPVQRRTTGPCRGTIHALRSAPSDGTAVDVDAIEHDARNFEANSFNKRQAIGEDLTCSMLQLVLSSHWLLQLFSPLSFALLACSIIPEPLALRHHHVRLRPRQGLPLCVLWLHLLHRLIRCQPSHSQQIRPAIRERMTSHRMRMPQLILLSMCDSTALTREQGLALQLRLWATHSLELSVCSIHACPMASESILQPKSQAWTRLPVASIRRTPLPSNRH